MAVAAIIKVMDLTIRLDLTVARTVDPMVAHSAMDRMDRTGKAMVKRMTATMEVDTNNSMAITNSMDINNSTAMKEIMATAMAKNTKLENNVQEKVF